MDKFRPKIKIPLTLGIKNWGFQLKKTGGITKQENEQKMKSQNVDRVDQVVDQFVRIGVLKGLLRFIFSLVSSGSLRPLPIQLSKSIFEVITVD